MRTINRSAVVVRPKEPFIQWAMHVDDTSYQLEDSIRKHLSVYLVPPDPHGRQEAAPLREYFHRIFVEELEGWHRDEAGWPQVRDLKTFHEWFEVEAESVVIDLDDETELAVEE